MEDLFLLADVVAGDAEPSQPFISWIRICRVESVLILSASASRKNHMEARLKPANGEPLTVEIPSQRSFPDWIIYRENVFQRVGDAASQSAEFHQVKGRVVVATDAE